MNRDMPNEQRLPHYLVFIFQVENVSPEKKQRKRRISATPFNRFSSSLHQNDRTVCGHLFLETDEPENVGKCKNLQKFSFLKPEYFFKKKLPTSNLVGGNGS